MGIRTMDIPVCNISSGYYRWQAIRGHEADHLLQCMVDVYNEWNIRLHGVMLN
jgi:hypothetical protein